MPHPLNPTGVDFDGPATYRITVKGLIEKRYCEYLDSMHITMQSLEDGAKVTMLTGVVKDQAELVGILDSIYNLHMPILSVQNIGDKERVGKERK